MTGCCVGFLVCGLGSPSCESMAPTLYADASVARKKGASYRGCRRMGFWHMSVFMVSKALNWEVSQWKGVAFFVRSMRGRAMLE